MIKNINLFIFALIVATNDAYANSIRFKCELLIPGWCEINAITQDLSHETFFFIAPHPWHITMFWMEESTFHHWTMDICRQFRNLVHFIAVGNKIREISDDAFESCTRLRELDLSYNEIEFMDSRVLRNLKHLRKLRLQSNNLKFFNAGPFEHLKQLKLLDLESNNLFDVNAYKIFGFCTQLKQFYLNDNNLICDRMQEILGIYEKADAVYALPELENKRTREEQPHTVEPLMCLSRDQWTKEFKKLTNANQLGICRDIAEMGNIDLIPLCPIVQNK